jgi:opacity protein-like surface antigen
MHQAIARLVPRGLVTALAAILVTAAVPPAHAAKLGVGPHVGFGKMSDSDEGSTVVGGHLDIHLSPWFAIVLAGDHRSEETVPVLRGNGAGTVRVKSVPVTGTLRLILPVSTTFAPYAGLGVGIHFVHNDYSRSINEAGLEDGWSNEIGAHGCVGMEFKLASFLSVYGEARGVLLDPGNDVEDAGLEARDHDYHGYQLAGGLSFHF